MFRFFIGGLFPVEADFRIAFSVGDSGHGEVHADFGAFAVEVLAEAFEDFGGDAGSDADGVFGGPAHGAGFFLKFGCRGFALRAEFRRGIAFVNVTADRTDKSFHVKNLLLN